MDAIAEKTVPGKTAKNGWCAGEDGGTAAPPTQPDSRELAAAVSAEVLSASLPAKANVIVSTVECPAPCAGCRLDGLLHPGQGTASAGQISSAWATCPAHRHERRRGYRQPPEDWSPGARWRAQHHGRRARVPEPARRGQAGSHLHGPHPTSTRVTSSGGGGLSPRACKQRHATGQAITWTS